MILKWIVSIIAVANCTMIRCGDQSTWCSNMNELSLFNFNVDIIRHQCLVYDRSFEHDAATKTAQAFACLGTIFAVFPMLKVVALQLFLHWKPVLVWKAIWIKLLEAILSQATFFSGFATDICVWDLTIKCFPGPAGIINVINVILLSVLCWLCWGMAPQTCPSLADVKLMLTGQWTGDKAVSAPTDESFPAFSNENYQEDAYNNTLQQYLDINQALDSGWGITVQTSSIDEGNDIYANAASDHFARPNIDPVDTGDTVN